MGLTYYPEPADTERHIREVTQAFVDSEVRPSAIKDDGESRFRRELFNELASLKLHCLAQPEEFGGKGLSAACQYAAVEEIARASASLAIVVGVTNLPQGAIVHYGTDVQKERFLRPLIAGEMLGAFSLSESHAGSDAASLQCRATKTDKGYLINGSKMWCSSAGHADIYLLMARLEGKGVSAFLVPADTPGFRVGKLEHKLGLRASSLAELIFEDCHLDASQLLGIEGEGLSVALSELDAGRITIGVVGAALAREALDKAWALCGDPKLSLQLESCMRDTLADIYAQTQAVRMLISQVTLLKDQGKPLTCMASQVKLLGSDLAMWATSTICGLLGPVGVSVEYELERLMRDAKALQIVEGTNQIQRLVIGRKMEEMMRS